MHHQTYDNIDNNEYNDHIIMTGLGRLEVLEMRVASSAGTNSNSSFMPSSSSTPYVSTDKEREKEKDSLSSKLSDKSKVVTIGMVVKDKGKKKKEKKGKGDIVIKKVADSEENYTIDSVFRGKTNSIYPFLNFRTFEFLLSFFIEKISCHYINLSLVTNVISDYLKSL